MEYLSLKKEGHIGIVTLDRPPVNALNYQAYSEIFEVFDLVAKDPEIWCVIFQAKNRLFCAGNDLNELDANAQTGEDNHEIPYGDMVEKGLTAVINCKVPVITCVHSTAVGAGFCIATYSDIVLAAPEAAAPRPAIPCPPRWCATWPSPAICSPPSRPRTTTWCWTSCLRTSCWRRP